MSIPLANARGSDYRLNGCRGSRSGDRKEAVGQPFFSILFGCLFFITLPLYAQKFYPDDPLLPRTAPVAVPKRSTVRSTSTTISFRTRFSSQGSEEKHAPGPSQAVNTLGEVPDSAWYTNRSLSLQEMVRGPGDIASARDG